MLFQIPLNMNFSCHIHFPMVSKHRKFRSLIVIGQSEWPVNSLGQSECFKNARPFPGDTIDQSDNLASATSRNPENSDENYIILSFRSGFRGIYPALRPLRVLRPCSPFSPCCAIKLLSLSSRIHSSLHYIGLLTCKLSNYPPAYF